MGEESFIDTLTRRQLLRGGMVAGTAAFLAGCQQPTRVAQTVPGPLWPDLEKAAEDPPLPPTVRPAPEPNVVFAKPEAAPAKAETPASHTV
ncbi:MAG: twin-arginine translocation signal domain-containing protein, partial [Phycisphaerales bacterium]